ncbi:MAG: hypothetical protein ACJAWW_000356 [Sulfurimonas sp.]|jgi:hypothetical protein
MIKIVILSLLATLLTAGNPTVYSALGDVIYDNVEKIEKLKEIPEYLIYENKIDSYVKEVYKAKDIAYAIEAGEQTKDKGVYLQKIRTLSKTNDFFHRTIVSFFKSSMDIKNNDLFFKTVNSGLLDTQKYKREILEYYDVNCADMNASGVIQEYLDEDEKLNLKQNRLKKKAITKKQIQEAKIKRIRLKDKEKQESIQKTLEQELLKTKSNIRKEQVEELTKPN